MTIHAATAVGTLLLTPKITAFWKLHPGVTISQIVSDLPDVSGAGDIRIGYGLPDDKPSSLCDLFQDGIFALGTSRFAADPKTSKASDLLELPLINSVPIRPIGLVGPNDSRNWASGHLGDGALLSIII